MSLIIEGLARAIAESSTKLDQSDQIIFKKSDGTVLLTIDSDGTVKVGANKVVGTRGGAIADLTMSVGTADGTVDDVGAAFSQTTLNNNFREMGAKINAILAVLRASTGHGLIA